MKTEITASQIYWNKSLMNFFFRSQSERTFEELCERAKDKEELFDTIDMTFEDLDEFEEACYCDSVEEIFDFLGIESVEEEEEEEE